MRGFGAIRQVLIFAITFVITLKMSAQKRRNTVEATIGHAKFEHRMDRNYLLGNLGDAINALAAACGYNLRRIIDAIRCLCALILRMTIANMAKTDPWPAPNSDLRSMA